MGITNCSIDNCVNKPLSLKSGYCSTHYTRNKKYGSPYYTLRPNIVGKDKELYRTWATMKRRIQNKNTADYPYYGGRGITICDRWLGREGFKHFREDMVQRPTPAHTLDRIDVNKGYSPNNCRWATRKEQMNNMRRNRILKYKGETKTLEEWANCIGIESYVIGKRLKRGWTTKEALSTPKLDSRLGRPNR